MLKKEYKKGDLTVIWKPELCFHSKNCVNGLPSVFRNEEKPWIQPEGASIEEIKATIDRCPSGALSYRDDSNLESTETSAAVELETMKDGPVIVKGHFNLTVGGKKHEIASDVIALCRCGGSSKKPFCDGTHKKIGFQAE